MRFKPLIHENMVGRSVHTRLCVMTVHPPDHNRVYSGMDRNVLHRPEFWIYTETVQGGMDVLLCSKL